MTAHQYDETAFESVIEAHLSEHGFVNVTGSYDATRAIFPDEAITFIPSYAA